MLGLCVLCVCSVRWGGGEGGGCDLVFGLDLDVLVWLAGVLVVERQVARIRRLDTHRQRHRRDSHQKQ